MYEADKIRWGPTGPWKQVGEMRGVCMAERLKTCGCEKSGSPLPTRRQGHPAPHKEYNFSLDISGFITSPQCHREKARCKDSIRLSPCLWQSVSGFVSLTTDKSLLPTSFSLGGGRCVPAGTAGEAPFRLLPKPGC
jgi:hypothetical protein